MKWIASWGAAAVVLLLMDAPDALAATPHFRHPALLSTTEELDFVKEKVRLGAEPWKAAFDKAKASTYASPAWAPKARDTVACGANSDPNRGCNDETDDAIAAYTHAVLWSLTGDEANARKAVEILNAWSSKLKAHTLHNAPLQASWAAGEFAKAAEIIRYTYPKWASADVSRFSAMLDKAFLPLIFQGHSFANGNWELCFVDAMLSIGVFNEDTAAFNQGLLLLRKRIPAYFYLASDGRVPIRPYQTGKGLYGTNTFTTDSAMGAFWYSPGMYFDGLCQETCRDLGHTQLGLAAMINAAEIAYHQGIDIYAEFSQRITLAMEFHAKILSGNPWPKGLCHDSLNFILRDTWEVAYNHYHDRMGMELPFTRKFIEAKIRPSGTHLPMAWETLTHAGLGNLGGATHARLPSGAKDPGAMRGSFFLFHDSMPWIRVRDGEGADPADPFADPLVDLKGRRIPYRFGR